MLRRGINFFVKTGGNFCIESGKMINSVGFFLKLAIDDGLYKKSNSKRKMFIWHRT